MAFFKLILIVHILSSFAPAILWNLNIARLSYPPIFLLIFLPFSYSFFLKFSFPFFLKFSSLACFICTPSRAVSHLTGIMCCRCGVYCVHCWSSVRPCTSAAHGIEWRIKLLALSYTPSLQIGSFSFIYLCTSIFHLCIALVL